MTLKELIKKLQFIDEEVNYGAHPFADNLQVNVYSDNEDDDYSYELVELRPDQTCGCGCWVGCDIIIRRHKND